MQGVRGFLDSQKALTISAKWHRRLLHGRPATFRTAASFPNRIGAGASFHGANLANDKPTALIY